MSETWREVWQALVPVAETFPDAIARSRNDEKAKTTGIGRETPPSFSYLYKMRPDGSLDRLATGSAARLILNANIGERKS